MRRCTLLQKEKKGLLPFLFSAESLNEFMYIYLKDCSASISTVSGRRILPDTAVSDDCRIPAMISSEFQS